jgi:glycosyltransferase involved in cell wall biosynthesis
MNSSIYIYTAQKAHGISVIIENLIKAFSKKGFNCSHVVTLDGLSKDSLIIPFAVKEAVEVYEKGYRPFAAFLCDAISLGYRNKFKFYLSIGHVFCYDFLYSVYGYLRYSRKEKFVLNTYENTIFVAQVDIDYLKQKYPRSGCNYICVPNGVPEVNNVLDHVPSDRLRLGILSPWESKQIIEESNWFIRKYYKRYYAKHPNTVLKLAGRGSKINQFQNQDGIEVLGEVEDLADFFANIDVFISSNPKGCGILNRVLDAFMYKVPVLGHEASFSGFPSSDDICYKFNNYPSFESALEYINANRTDVRRRVENAIEYTKKNNNWERNYQKLVEILMKKI